MFPHLFSSFLGVSLNGVAQWTSGAARVKAWHGRLEEAEADAAEAQAQLKEAMGPFFKEFRWLGYLRKCWTNIIIFFPNSHIFFALKFINSYTDV